MLHSSILIQSIISILKGLEKWYDNSFIHRFIVFLGNSILNIGRGSGLFSFFKEFDHYVYFSLTYEILRFFIRLMNTIVTWVQIRMEEKLPNSTTFSLVKSFSNLDLFLSIIGLLSFGFGFSLMVIFVITKRIQGLIGLIFILLGIACLLLSKHSLEKLKGSRLVKIFSPFYKLFLPDEEANRWKF